MIALSVGKAALRGIYWLYKRVPVDKTKVLFMSRQGDSAGTDFLLLKEEIEKLNPQVKVRMICKTLDGGLLKKLGYVINLAGPQLYELATSKVAILDSYSIPVSILNHRKELKVVQIWHAMGALKKFGKSIVGKVEGRSEKLAEAMEMHRNYDYILASSKESARYFGEAFGYDEERFIIGALPRTDLLLKESYSQECKDKFYEKYPELKGQKLILYAPTIRRTQEDISKTEELIQEVKKFGGYALVVSPHPVKRKPYMGVKDILVTDFSTFELLNVCHYLVTDYSAIVYEAAVKELPIFLYAYDIEEYLANRGFYLDYEKDMPADYRKDAAGIMKMIVSEDWNKERVRAFADRYITKSKDSTKDLAKEILKLLSN